MARRIRTIKPEFWGDEKLAPLDCTARLVFLGLISMADDAGRLVDNIKSIDGFIFPDTDDTSRQALDTLATTSRITRYESWSGQRLIQITNWSKHQKVDKPSRYVLPGPAAGEPPREPRESLATVSRSDLGPRTMDHGPRTEDHGAVTAVAAPAAAAAADDRLKDLVYFLAEHDFGAFARSVAGMVRASRNPAAVIATMRMHLTGELGHERATPTELGLACQQFAANGTAFNAAFFAGFVRGAKRGIARVESRQRNASEDRAIAAEREASQQRAADEATEAAMVARFAAQRPDEYATLQRAAELAVPPSITLGRQFMVSAELAQRVRHALKEARAS